MDKFTTVSTVIGVVYEVRNQSSSPKLLTFLRGLRPGLSYFHFILWDHSKTTCPIFLKNRPPPHTHTHVSVFRTPDLSPHIHVSDFNRDWPKKLRAGGGGSTGLHSKICRKRSSNGSTHWIFVIKLDITIIECSLVEKSRLRTHDFWMIPMEMTRLLQ